MISNENLGSIMGAPVVGPDDDRIGTVGQVFVDPTTGAPNWVTVHTGLFGRHETFVPLNEATWDREVLHVPYEKDLVKEAPRIDTDEALTPRAEDDLYRYYRMGAEASDDDEERDDDEHEDRTEDADAAPTTGESLRLRKYTVTEEHNVTVPVTHEEVRLEPDSDAEAPGAEANGDKEGSSDRNRRGRHRA
ncbi:DUF2382 domain-containing protein [Homoserinimonas sp. A447]